MADISNAPPLITLLTDFGNRDGYVGVMKGVIACISPHARVVDLTHEIPPQDIRSGAFLLGEWFRYFPQGAIHVAVVDPGVGSARRGLAVFSHGHCFIGPDNGVLGRVLEGARVHLLSERKYWLEEVSNTFHGRDVFAPVAAWLSRGRAIQDFGPPCPDPVRLDSEDPTQVEEGWRGEVVYVDRFGNLVTSFHRRFLDSLSLESGLTAYLADGSCWPLRSTYSEVPPGETCAVVGGFGRLELSVNQGNAAKRTGVKVGDTIMLRPAESRPVLRAGPS